MLEQIADAIIDADRSGTIRQWNHAAASLFGYSASKAIGQSLDLIIPEHLRERHWLGFDAAMANGAAVTRQGRPTLTRATHKSGSKLYVQTTFAGVNTDGQEKAIVAGALSLSRTERPYSATTGHPSTL